MMDELNLDLLMEALGLKEVIMGVIVVVFLYMLWLLLRMIRLSMGTKSDDLSSLSGLDADKKPAEDSSWNLMADSGLKSLASSLFGNDEVSKKDVLEREKRAALYAEVGSNLRLRGGQPLPPSGGAASAGNGSPAPVVRDRNGAAAPPTLSSMADPRVQTMAKELESMRGEVKALKQNLSSLQTQWQTEINQVQMSHNTAPIYSDAMHLATQGLDAAAIASRCDIPLGEATLVVALAGKKKRA